jgi:hypothetical protein
MKTLIEFLSLRPMWTRRGLEVVWYAYLAATLLHLGYEFNFLFVKNVTVNGAYGFALIHSTLFALANLALVRIFLELALRYLLSTSNEVDSPRP